MDWVNDVNGNMKEYSYDRLDDTAIKWSIELKLKHSGIIVKDDFLNNGDEVAFPGLEELTSNEIDSQIEVAETSESNEQEESAPQSSSPNKKPKWTQCEVFAVEDWDTVDVKAVIKLDLFKNNGALIQELSHITSLDQAQPSLRLMIESSSSRFKEVYASEWSRTSSIVSDANKPNEIRFEFSLPKGMLAKTVKIRPLICLGQKLVSTSFNHAQRKGQILAEGQTFKLEVDQPKKSGTGALRIEWVDFSESVLFNDCKDALYNLSLGDDPYLKLNSGHSKLRELLDSSSLSGKKKELRISYFNMIAADVTFDMIRWAICEKAYMEQIDPNNDLEPTETMSGGSKLIKDLIKFATKANTGRSPGLGLSETLLKKLVTDLSDSGWTNSNWAKQQKIKSRIQQHFKTGTAINIASNNWILRKSK
jgi:hypothetical protein